MRRDLEVLTQGFAAAVAAGRLRDAEAWAAAAFEVAAGGLAWFPEPRRDVLGRPLCPALTRQGVLCARLAGPEGFCSVHARLAHGGLAWAR
jgi:hypothetical protein